MHPTELIPALEETETFREWKEKNPDAKIVHLFLLLDPGKDTKYDIGFYDPKKKLMTSFVADGEMKDIEISESKEIFTKDTASINPLDMSKVKTSFEQAMETCRKLQQEKYAKHEPLKEVVILQKLEQGQVWNITYITKTFQTLNIKVDAETGEVVEDDLHQIFSFG